MIDVGVYIGRFQPFHNGHLRVVRQALAFCDRVVICVGSCQETGTLKNPWNLEDRGTMIMASLKPSERKRVRVTGLELLPEALQALEAEAGPAVGQTQCHGHPPQLLRGWLTLVRQGPERHLRLPRGLEHLQERRLAETRFRGATVMIESIGDGNPHVLRLGPLTFNVSASGLEVETCGLIFRFTEVAFARSWMKTMAEIG